MYKIETLYNINNSIKPNTMLSSFYTDFTDNSVTINRVKFDYDPATHAVSYHGAPIETKHMSQGGLDRIEFLDIPALKRTVTILDYYHLRNVYSFKDADISPPTCMNNPSKFKRPYYYDLKPDIYFTAKPYEKIVEEFDDAFAPILEMRSAHSYFLKFKEEHAINVNIFFADDETGYIIELEYLDREYGVFREFQRLFEAILEG